MVIISEIQDSVNHLWDTRLPCDFHFRVLVVIWLVLILPFLLVSGTNLCPNDQTAELGEPGHIHCSLPEDINEVYWFDNIAVSSDYVIKYTPSDGVKSGPGFESGEYDVDEDGSLFISNVTTWHQRMYRVIVFSLSLLTPDTLFISLIVTASPIDEYPVIVCHNCYHEYYYSLKDKETPSCSFNAARPPVQLEWFEYFDDGYDLVEIQQFNSSENRNGTYNSLATLHSLKDSSMIHLLVCRATWPLSDWRREKEILVDSSSKKSFSDVTPKTQYMVVNTHAVIVCGGSSSAYVVWKRILTNSEPEVVGFHSHVKTETISSITDVKVSAAEGNLIFSSPQVHHEGIYACIYGGGQKEEILMTSVELLIPPSPPYIQIAGCDNVSHSCVFKEDSTKKLTCAVYGVRPIASLEWIAEDEDQISFFKSKLVLKKSSETTDTILSVEYKVSQDVLCGEEILIGCHLYGPLSKIMKAESTALVIPASCKEHGETGKHGLGGGVIAFIAVICTFWVVGIALIIIYLMRRYRTKSPTGKPVYNGLATDDPKDAFLQTGNGKRPGHKPSGSPLHHVEDEQML